MEKKQLRSIKFPGLPDTYEIPEGGSEGGADGYSPVAKVEETSDGAKITITDKTGTTEATVKNGTDGTPGADGFSPEATVTPINGGVKIIIKDKNGTTSANVMNGTQGQKGDPGADYVLTDADKTEIAEAVIAGGIEAQLGDEPLPAPASATVGQFIRAKTVVDGKITETEAADVSGGGGGTIQWIEVADITTTEQLNTITVNTDADGDPFSDYHAVAMAIALSIPADSTQTSANGSVQFFCAKNASASYRAILSIAEWKTAERIISEIAIGWSAALVFAGVAQSGAKTNMDPVGEEYSEASLLITTAGDHFPVGTQFKVYLLSGGKA